MTRRRNKHHGSFNTRTQDGAQLTVEVWVVEVKVSTLNDTHDSWTEVSRAYESRLGPVNSDEHGNLTLARDGSPLTRC
jgi:hypothetical protein